MFVSAVPVNVAYKPRVHERCVKQSVIFDNMCDNLESVSRISYMINGSHTSTYYSGEPIYSRTTVEYLSYTH